MTEKKVVLVMKNLRLNKMICSNLQCFVRKNTMFSPHDLAFQLIKGKKNYKAKLSTNLILKKKPTKIILEGKKPMRKNVAAIDNVL
jgi:hypothetical protein